MVININSDAVVRHTARLEKIHRSALPVAVRNTLNSAAFDVKKETMPASAAKEFIHRKPSFFKAKSKVEMAKGFSLASMKATVGFVGNDQAIEDLQQQQQGGTIKGRAFIPTKQARTGNSWNKNVRPANRISAIKSSKIINTNNVKANSRKQKFIRAAFMAAKMGGKNAYVMGNDNSGQRTLSRINSISSNKGKLRLSRTPLYSYKRGRGVKIAGTNFMKRASMESGLKMEQMFIKHAEAQMKKYK